MSNGVNRLKTVIYYLGVAVVAAFLMTMYPGLGAIVSDKLLPSSRLAVAPAWRTGDWWRIRGVDRLTGKKFDIIQVIAGQESGNYLVGFSADTFSDEVLLLHTPGFGRVRRTDLAYDVHGGLFQPVSFPLKQDAQWRTSFEGYPAFATVKSVSPVGAVVAISGRLIIEAELTYDAKTNLITQFEGAGYASWKVVSHGHGYTGRVLVPVDQSVIFVRGRAPGVFGFPARDDEPVQMVDVPDRYTDVSLAILVGSRTASSSSANPVTYRARVIDPAGKTYESALTSVEPPGSRIGVYHSKNPAGAWKLEQLAPPPGFSIMEGVAYRLLEVELNKGEVVMQNLSMSK